MAFEAMDIDPDATAEAERLDRERAFHNERFATENRDAQEKFYVAIRDCDRRMQSRVQALAAGADVLEYGCATGYHSFGIAPVARSVHGIDISDVAIAKATAEARRRGLTNATFAVADAMATGLPDASYDLIFGSGIIHHLDTERSVREIHRLLRPGGTAIFKEPLGGNLLIEAYRRATPDARTADEHPLLARDFAIMRSLFDRVDLRHYGLATLAAVPFRRTPVVEPLYRALASLDAMLLRLPVMRDQAWYALIELKR